MNKYALHGGRRFYTYFTDVNGAPVDPASPAMLVMKPGNQVATSSYALQHGATGTYYINIPDFDTYGEWTITRRCTGGAELDEVFEVVNSRFA